MFIPGMLPIPVLFAERFCDAVLFLPGVGFWLCIPDIFIPGMFIPGILLMSCFLAVCFLRVIFRFFRVVIFDLDFAFGLLMPGILLMSCPSCCGKAFKLTANIRVSAPSIPLIQLLSLFIFFPSKVRQNELIQMFLSRKWK